MLQNINKFLLFFYLPLAATIILDFSLRLTHTSCYSSLLPTDFPSFSLHLSLSSHPSSLFFLAHSCSLLPSRDTHVHSSSPRTYRPSPSLLSTDDPPLHFYSDFSSSSSLFFSRHLVSLTCLPLRSSFFPTLCPPSHSLPLSVPFSHTSHSLLRMSCSFSLVFPISSLSRSPFIPRGCTLLPAFPVLSFYPSYHSLWRRTSLSSHSIELRSSGSFYLARSSYFLLFLFFFFCVFSLLHLPFLSLFLSFPLSSSSFARSHGFLRAQCVSFLAFLYMFVILYLLLACTRIVATRALYLM